MAEEYIENIIIRRDGNDEVETPSFFDEQCDGIFEFEGVLKLVQILKSVQNAQHNRHDYVFKIVSIGKMEQQGE